MMIIMRDNATAKEIEQVVERIRSIGAETHLSRGEL